MSNTIKRPRRRPRVKSVNFRSLWWVVAREAAWVVLPLPCWSELSVSNVAAWLRQPTYRLREKVEQVLKHHPERRYYP